MRDGANSRRASRFRPPEEDLLLFFSRRIGLTDGGEQLPLHGGAPHRPRRHGIRGHHDAVPSCVRTWRRFLRDATTGPEHLIAVETDHSRAFSGSARLTVGDFWSGAQRSAQISLLYRPTSRLVFDAGVQVSDIALQVPMAFTTTLVNLRTDTCSTTTRSTPIAMSPRAGRSS
ncbi:MAG: hypothetical protein OEW19_16505 [Acidobacteriota bacterium]|nr:hypothetical protein [Acidobacteriota bacterium]